MRRSCCVWVQLARVLSTVLEACKGMVLLLVWPLVATAAKLLAGRQVGVVTDADDPIVCPEQG